MGKEKEQFSFSIQSLLTEKDGTLRGPMSPMLFAGEMGEQVGFTFNRLARVWFADERINQCREDGGLTGHDTLLIGTEYKNDLWLSLWVDSGVGGTAIAMCYRSDGEVQVTEVYGQARYARKLSTAEVRQVFQSVFDDPTQIKVKTQTA